MPSLDSQIDIVIRMLDPELHPRGSVGEHLVYMADADVRPGLDSEPNHPMRFAMLVGVLRSLERIGAEAVEAVIDAFDEHLLVRRICLKEGAPHHDDLALVRGMPTLLQRLDTALRLEIGVEIELPPAPGRRLEPGVAFRSEASRRAIDAPVPAGAFRQDHHRDRRDAGKSLGGFLDEHPAYLRGQPAFRECREYLGVPDERIQGISAHRFAFQLADVILSCEDSIDDEQYSVFPVAGMIHRYI